MHRPLRYIPFLLALSSASVASLQGQSRGPMRTAADGIQATSLAQAIGVIAHDSMGGRATPSPGLDRTAGFLSREFERAGLRPAGDSSGFVQRYSLDVGNLVPDGAALTLAGRRFVLGRDAYLIFDHFAWPSAKGKVVLISGTKVVPAELHRAALGDKAVILVSGIDSTTLRLYKDLVNPVMLQNPPILILATDRPDSLRAALRGNLEGPVQQLSIASSSNIRGPHNHGLIEVPRQSLEPILAAAGVDLAAALRRRGERIRFTPLRGIEASLDLPRRITSTVSAPNVVGLLRGSDPRLRDEYVVVTAHMDHLGSGAPVDGDSIYNGADDNASGTAVLLEVARALARLPTPPRRSVLFVATSGEEVGQHGGLLFLHRPPVPLGSMVANINIDGVGRPALGDTIALLGRSYSTLGQRAARILSEHPELGFAALIEDKAFVQRGDHINFASRGVPSVSLFSGGLHPYYHQPNDDAGVIDAEFVTRIARLTLYLVADAANASERPAWHSGGSETMRQAR